MAIIAVLTLAFVLSAVSGVHKGIQWLSNINMLLAIALVLFLLVVGPTVFQLETLVESIGGYLTTIVPASFQTGAFGDQEWLSAWTIFYWAWWISWAPFVGTFIARISRGRTIREFVIGVLLVPSGVSFVWFAVFGGAAIDLQLSGAADLSAITGTPEIALFTTLEEFPLSGITSFVVIVLVALFFISGADAASLVMGMLSSRGSLNPARGGDGRLGSLDRRGCGNPAARERPVGAPAGGDHCRGAVHARDDRSVHLVVQGACEGGGAVDHSRSPLRVAPESTPGRVPTIAGGS